MVKRNNILITFVVLVVILISAILYNMPLHKQTIPTRFIAGENMGFDLGPGNLNFGLIVPGYSASRDITITNSYEKSTITKITSLGTVSKYIIVSENNFILQPSESKNITFFAFPPKGLELGEYPGEIIITTARAPVF